MSDYIVPDTEFIGVADHIRTKAGTSGGLVWPTGFEYAIDAISGVQYDTLTVADGDWGIYFWGTTDDGMKNQYHVLPGSSINVLHNSMFMVGPDDNNNWLHYSPSPNYVTVQGYNINGNIFTAAMVNWNNKIFALISPNIMFSNGDLTIRIEHAGGGGD